MSQEQTENSNPLLQNTAESAKDSNIIIQNSDDSSSENENSTYDILTNASQPINKQFILNYTKSEHENISKEVKESCKIIKFTSEWNYDEILMEIAKLDRKVYQNLFIFIFELDIANSGENFKILKNFLLKFGENRPIIMELKSVESTKFFYKDEISAKFKKLKRSNNFNLDNFQNFFWSFMDSKFENFEDAMLQKLPCTENSTMILRFLRSLELSEDFFEDLILECASYGFKYDFLAAIDIPFEHNGTIPESPSTKCLGIRFRYGESTDENSTTKSVLSNALEESNYEVLDILINDCLSLIKKLPFDHKVDISTAAYDTKQINHLCDLIELCDFPFPKNFDVKSITDERLLKIIEKRTQFHEAIVNENTEEINKFMTENPNIKMAFSTKNDSALYQAINSSKFAILFHLKSHGFRATEFNDYEEALTDTQDKKTADKYATKQTTENIKKAVPCPENPSLILATKSFIHNKGLKKETQDKHHAKIRKWLNEIYTVKNASPLIDVAAKCDDLRIVFNFESELCSDVDMRNSRAEGLTYTSSGYIIIGANYSGGKRREQKIKGVLIHELCHYVMRIVYENDEKPYFKADQEADKLFTEITKSINKWTAGGENIPNDGCDGIISVVYRCYNAIDFQQELIVRVVQILVEFSNDEDKIEKLTEMYNQLFSFHYQKVLPDLLKFITSDRENVRKFNKDAGLLAKIKGLDCEFSELKDTSLLAKNSVNIVQTNQPTLLLLNIYKNLHEKFGSLIDAENIFVKFQKFSNSLELRKISSSNPKMNIFVDCSDGIAENVSPLHNTLDSSLTFIVSNEDTVEKLQKILKKFSLNPIKSTININWMDLTSNSQKKLLQTKIFIRCHQVALIDLITSSSDSKNQPSTSSNVKTQIRPIPGPSRKINQTELQLKNIPKNQNEEFSNIIDDELLTLLVNKSKISINTDFNSEGIDKDFKLGFIPRMFLKKSQNIYGPGISQEDLFASVQYEKYILISDLAGTGKSWALQNIAETFGNTKQLTWISLIDLKQFIEVFKLLDNKIIAFEEKMSKCSEEVKDVSEKQEAKIISESSGKVTQSDIAVNLQARNEMTMKESETLSANVKFDTNILEDTAKTTESSIKAQETTETVPKESASTDSNAAQVNTKAQEQQSDKILKMKLEILNYLIDKILSPKHKFQSRIFKKMYRTGRVFIFLDGFDEIAPDCTELVSHLAAAFDTKCGNQLWIATRDYFEIDLQKKLGTDAVYKLKSFTEEEEIKLITNGWILKELGDTVKNKSRTEVKKLIKENLKFDNYQRKATELNKKLNNLKQSSIGIPQFYKIIVKVLSESRDYVIEPSLFKIFEKFIKVQYQRWSNEKGDIRKTASIEVLAKYFMNFQELHIFFAMYSLYPDIECFYDLEYEPSTWTMEEIVACGLVTINNYNILFVHETFREYFAAQFIVRVLMKSRRSVGEDFCRFFVDFLTIPKYGIIRVFLDEAIADAMVFGKLEAAVPKIAQYFHENVTNFESLPELFDKNLKNLQNVITKILDLGKYENVKKIFLGIKKFISYSADKNEYFPQLLDFTFKVLNVDDVKDILIKLDDKQLNSIHFLALNNKNVNIFQDYFEILRKHLSDSQYAEVLKFKGRINRSFIQHAAVHRKDVELFKILWKVFRNFYTDNNEFVTFLRETDGTDRDVFENLMFFSSCEAFELLIGELEKIISHQDMKDFVRNLEHTHLTTFHEATAHNHFLEMNKILIKIAEKYFSPAEMLEYPNDNDECRLCLQYCVIAPELLKIAVDEIESFITEDTPQDIKNLFLACQISLDYVLSEVADVKSKIELNFLIMQLRKIVKNEKWARVHH